MAGRIPQEFINDLLDRVDVSEVIGARVELKRAGKEFKGLCPFHGEDALFHVVPEKGSTTALAVACTARPLPSS